MWYSSHMWIATQCPRLSHQTRLANVHCPTCQIRTLCQTTWQIECQNIRQIKCHRECQTWEGGDESQPPNKCSGGVFSLRFMLCALHLRAVHHRDQFFAAGSVPISIDLLLAYPTMTRFPHCLEKNSGPKQLSHSTALFDYNATSLKPNASRGKI